jgi:hypothetical protein
MKEETKKAAEQMMETIKEQFEAGIFSDSNETIKKLFLLSMQSKLETGHSIMKVAKAAGFTDEQSWWIARDWISLAFRSGVMLNTRNDEHSHMPQYG